MSSYTSTRSASSFSTHAVRGTASAGQSFASDVSSPKYHLSFNQSDFFANVSDSDCGDAAASEALHEAAATNNVMRLRALLASSPRGGRAIAQLRDKSGRTALHWAAERGSVPAVAMLLAHAPLMATRADDAGRTPVCLAAREGHADVVDAIARDLEPWPLELAIALNKPDFTSTTPLGHAVKKGRDADEVAKVLTLLGAEADAVRANQVCRAASMGRRWRASARRHGRRRAVRASAKSVVTQTAVISALGTGMARNGGGNGGLARQKSGVAGIAKARSIGVVRTMSIEGVLAEALRA